MAREVLSAEKVVAYTIFLGSTCPLLPETRHVESRAWKLVRLLGDAARRCDHSPSITAILDDSEINFRGGDHGLETTDGLDLPLLSREMGVHIIVCGFFSGAFQLPGAFIVGTSISMALNEEGKWVGGPGIL